MEAQIMNHRSSEEEDVISSWSGEEIIDCHIFEFEFNIYYECLSKVRMEWEKDLSRVWSCQK